MERQVPVSWLYLVAAVAVFAILFLAYVSLELQALSDQYRELEYQYSLLRRDYQDLSAQYDSLQEDYDDLWESYLDLNIAYESLSDRYDDLYDDFVNEVHAIYQWLYGASKMKPYEFSREVYGCVQGEFINYPCVIWKRHYEYIPDVGDRASAYPEFVSRGGGDCEDFAFYAFALINAASRAGYRMRFMQESPGSRFWIDSRRYYPGYRVVEVRPYRTYVVCGFESEDANYEHCVVQVCDLLDCYWVEPQTGEVLSQPFVRITTIISQDDFVWYGERLSTVALRWGVVR